MNHLTIIGNLTRDPEEHITKDGVSVVSFTVAVNRRTRNSSDGGNNNRPDADFFRVSAWRALGETCMKYLSKGRKVCVIGPVSCRTYQGTDGVTRASLEVNADDVEFLSPRSEGDASAQAANAPQVSRTAPEAKQTALPNPGNMDRAEQAYIAAERQAIQNEKQYVVVDPNDDFPF